MDSLSHIVLGAAIGEAILGKKIGKKAMLWGALGASLPDIDVLFSPLFHPVDALFTHRGITHSFLFILIIVPFLGWLFSRLSPLPAGEGRGGGSWYSLFFITILSHPLLDSCTMYGTGFFEPFSNYRAQLASFFIVEPLYTLPLLAGFIALLILKRDSVKRKFWVKFGLSISTAVLILSIGNKFYVEKIFANSMQKQNIQYSDFITSPTPFNNILWNAFAKDTNGYWVGFYSHLDKTKDIRFSFIPRNDSLAGDLLHHPMVQKLVRFSNGYYCFTRYGDELHFNDLRFAFSGDFTPDADRSSFVFSFTVKEDKTTASGIKIQQNPWGNSRFTGFSNLIERIKGI